MMKKVEEYFSEVEKLNPIREQAIAEIESKLKSLDLERTELVGKLNLLNSLASSPKKTLRELIIEVLKENPSGLMLQQVASKIIAKGFKTTSTKFANTVRVQLYRLDDDKLITICEDGIFKLA
jgi:hypothetical protein